MERVGFEPQHEDFRESARRFVAAEIAPHHEQWERDGIVPRELFGLAAEKGMIGFEIPEEHGGLGLADFRFNQVFTEEVCEAGVIGSGLGLIAHSDIILPYFLRHASEEQRQRWLPGIAAGEVVTALAMTEPGTGSDLAAIRTTAERGADGYLVNGAKTFITNGINADLVVTAAKTDPAAGRRGISLLVLEPGMAGFERGRNLAKVGLHAQDTAELFFNDVTVPAENLLGEEGRGFEYLIARLARERLSVAACAVAAARGGFELTLEYVRDRPAFGGSVADFQATRFALAEMRTDLELATVFIDRAVAELNAGRLSVEDAAMAKWWCTEMQGRVLDRCVQLHGGYGYMEEYPIARAWADARVSRIYGGTTEVMKEIIGRSLTR